MRRVQPRGRRAAFVLLHSLASVHSLPLCHRSDRGARHGQPEGELQAACVAWLREMNYMFVASAVAQYANGARTWASLQRRGVEAGQYDLMILEMSPATRRRPPGILTVELKIGSNRLTKKQEWWGARARRRGHATAVAYTLEGFKAAVNDHIYPGQGNAASPYVVDA